MAPHCYGKMVWILKYPEGQEEHVCSCQYRKPCLQLTWQYNKKILALPEWLKNTRAQERSKIDAAQTVCIVNVSGLPKVFELDYPEDKSTDLAKHPDAAIISVGSLGGI